MFSPSGLSPFLLHLELLILEGDKILWIFVFVLFFLSIVLLSRARGIFPRPLTGSRCVSLVRGVGKPAGRKQEEALDSNFLSFYGSCQPLQRETRLGGVSCCLRLSTQQQSGRNGEELPCKMRGSQMRQGVGRALSHVLKLS